MRPTGSRCGWSARLMVRDCPVNPAPPSAQRKSVSSGPPLRPVSKALLSSRGGWIAVVSCFRVRGHRLSGRMASLRHPPSSSTIHVDSPHQLDEEPVPVCGPRSTPPFRSVGGEIPYSALETQHRRNRARTGVSLHAGSSRGRLTPKICPAPFRAP